jgi:hypothetical protein
MTTPVHALVPAFDDRPVLASAPLKAGHAREELSHVGDPTWDLGPAVFRENARRCHVTVHFDVLEHADVQAAMRAYLYARLNVDLPGYHPKLPPASIRQAFNRARRFFAFARERLGRLDLGRIDQALIDAMRATCGMIQRGDPSSSASSCRWSPISTISGITCLEAVSGSSRGPERRARRRISACAREPHPTHAGGDVTPLLAWSLRYVTTFATDILAARVALDRLEAAALGCSPPNADCLTQSAACGSARASSAISRAEPGKDAACPSGRRHNGATRIDPHRGCNPADQRPSPPFACRHRCRRRAGHASHAHYRRTGCHSRSGCIAWYRGRRHGHADLDRSRERSAMACPLRREDPRSRSGCCRPPPISCAPI